MSHVPEPTGLAALGLTQCLLHRSLLLLLPHLPHSLHGRPSHPRRLQSVPPLIDLQAARACFPALEGAGSSGGSVDSSSMGGPAGVCAAWGCTSGAVEVARDDVVEIQHPHLMAVCVAIVVGYS